MKLKMLTSYAGIDFALSPGDETDRFSDKEAKRLIAAGHAEKAPPPVIKKPETKQEWDEEREALLAENANLQSNLEAAEAEVLALADKAARFDAFAASVSGALLTAAPPETAVQPNPTEKRG